MPQLGELADGLVDKRERSGRADFRRALVLHMLQGHEADFDADPKGAAARIIAHAKRLEQALDVWELDERERDSAATIAADLIAEAQRQPPSEQPIFRDCAFDGCKGVALDGEHFCADHVPHFCTVAGCQERVPNEGDLCGNHYLNSLRGHE